MARTYRTSAGTRLVNRVFHAMIRLGLGKEYRHILTVRGRRTSKPHSTPVDIMQRDGQRWLVAPYGVTNWVRNARAAGYVTLSRGRRSETLRVAELGADDSVPVLRQYLREVPVTQAYFDVTPNSPDQQIAAETPRHPVFLLSAATKTRRGAGAAGSSINSPPHIVATVDRPPGKAPQSTLVRLARVGLVKGV